MADISEIFNHLGSTIKFFGLKSSKYITGKERSNITEFGPFCGRRLLESACTVFLGRIDPFRILLVKRFQSEPTYNIGFRGKLSIQWAGDIIASNKLPQEPWGQSVELKDTSRALFSSYSHELFWKNAFIQMQDDLAQSATQWLNELNTISPEGITNYYRTEADKLFSSLSKGIHTEFVVSNAVSYDSATVITLLQNTIAFICKVSTVANFIPTSLIRLNSAELVSRIKAIEQEVII